MTVAPATIKQLPLSIYSESCNYCLLQVVTSYIYTYISRYIKLTSPILNVFICLGAVLSYTEVVLLGIPNDDIAFVAAFCNVRYIHTYIHTYSTYNIYR